MGLEDEKRQLDAAREALVAEFAGQLAEGEIDARLSEVVRAFDAAPVRGFVPVLVLRQARSTLRHAVAG